MPGPVSYACRRCGYTAPKKAYLVSHLTRVNACPALLEDVGADALLQELRPGGVFPCELCRKTFAHNSSRARHRRRCPAAGGGAPPAPPSPPSVVQQTAETIINNSISIHNHFMLVPFGREDKDFLFEERFRRVMERCLADPTKGVAHIIRLVHFDAARPQYHNVMIPNVSRPHASCFYGSAWVISDKDAVLRRLVTSGAGSMYAYYDERGAALPQPVRTRFDAFDAAHSEQDAATQRALRREAERAVLNSQDAVGVRDKARAHRRLQRLHHPAPAALPSSAPLAGAARPSAGAGAAAGL